MTLGQRIQHHRTILNLSQEALGEKLGVTRQAVHKWEADGAVPDTDKLIALSKLFSITLNELLQVEEPKKAEKLSAAEEEPHTEENTKPTSEKTEVNLKLRTTLMAAAILILGVATMLSAINVGRLQKDVSSLKEQMSQLEHPGLDPAAPLVASFDFDISSQGTNVSVYTDLLPYQLPEDLEVSFTLSSADVSKSRTVTATRNEGGHYTATLNMEGALQPLTVTAIFSDSVNEYAQALVRIDSYYQYAYTWESLWDK